MISAFRLQILLCKRSARHRRGAWFNFPDLRLARFRDRLRRYVLLDLLGGFR